MVRRRTTRSRPVLTAAYLLPPLFRLSLLSLCLSLSLARSLSLRSLSVLCPPLRSSQFLSPVSPPPPSSFSPSLSFCHRDQGEADAKRTSSQYYATEFPKLITGWRLMFQTPALPFFYVELCSEYGAC
jgi:hypothetical protein